MFNFVYLQMGAFLHWTAQEGHVDLVRYFVDKGAPINFKDDDEVLVEEGERKRDKPVKIIWSFIPVEGVNAPKLLS